MKKKFLLPIIFQILLIVLFVSCVPSGRTDNFNTDVKVALREVGNQLLLTANDSTSVVLPVIEISQTRFELAFENDITFDPNDLNKIVKVTLEKADLPDAYVVEVIRCSDKEVAYSYTIKQDVEKNIIPCGGRLVPYGCYTIELAFTETSYVSGGNVYLFYFLVFLVLSFLVFVFYTRYITFKKGSIEELGTSLGMFYFYPEQLTLVKASTNISLTQKECELLEILVAKKNQVVTREELSKRIWEDNGVIVGRSLDTYISKLRKILQEDDSLKIVNIHGVGYKLETT